YKIDKEDNIDYKKVYYADLVLKNNAEGFKKLLPNVETYQNFKELNGEKDIPTFAAASYYIRNLEHYLNNSFIKDNATNKKEINPLEYNTLVRKILQILKDTKFSEEFNVTKTIPEQAKTTKDKIFRFLMPHINIWDSKTDNSNPKDAWGYKKWNNWSSTWEYTELDVFNSEREEHYFDKVYKLPSLLWKYNRIFSFSGSFENELFLSTQFYEKNPKFDQNTMAIDYEIFDYFWRNRVKVYSMQIDLWEMLVAYLELQVAMTDPINGGNFEWDEEKTLKKNLREKKIDDVFKNFKEKTLNYMKLSQLFGYTLQERNNPITLQLFPGGTNYQYETDFRHAYKWAWNEYHKFIQPLQHVFYDRGDIESDLRRNFDSKYAKYYDFIWKNIELVDKINKPHLIPESEANARLNIITSHYKNKFNWKFKIE
ncbi:MAG3960 family lipoprotein, partial [Metamycoplasma alkalescens]